MGPYKVGAIPPALAYELEVRCPLLVARLRGCGATQRSKKGLSGPLNRLNAILSLLQPLDCYRTPSAIGSAIGRPLSSTAWF